MSSIGRFVAVGATAALLCSAGPLAHAATAAGDERLGTWLALGAALLVALAAGAAAAIGPRPVPVPRRMSASPAQEPAPVPTVQPRAPRYAGEDDTMVQRALAAEVRARRAHTDHRSG